MPKFKLTIEYISRKPLTPYNCFQLTGKTKHHLAVIEVLLDNCTKGTSPLLVPLDKDGNPIKR